MSRKQLEQGSSEWHAWRNSKICASDAPVIMGVSPYKTAFELYQEKKGISAPQAQSRAMALGSAHEDTIRSLLEQEVGVLFMPACYESDEVDFMGASLDGIDIDETTACELKYNCKEKHAMAKDGKIWAPHVIQMLHAWAACPSSVERFIYGSYNSGELVAKEFSFDGDRLLEIVAKEREFWDQLQSNTPPEKPIEYALINSTYYHELIAERMALEPGLVRAEAIDAELKAAAGGRNSLICDKARVTTFSRKGGVDYSKIPALEGIDLEPYRKKSSVVIKLEYL